jgi:hypothetical protein
MRRRTIAGWAACALLLGACGLGPDVPPGQGWWCFGGDGGSAAYACTRGQADPWDQAPADVAWCEAYAAPYDAHPVTECWATRAAGP